MKKLLPLFLLMLMATSSLQAQLLKIVYEHKNEMTRHSIPGFLMKDGVTRFITFNEDSTVIDIYGKGFIKEKSLMLSKQLREAITVSSYYQSPADLEYHNLDASLTNEYGFSGITQTLFNKDEGFEFITETFTKKINERTGYTTMIPSAVVRNEKGEILFQFPEGETPLALIEFNEEYYISTAPNKKPEPTERRKIYKIDRNNPAAILQIVNTPALLRVLNPSGVQTTTFSLSEPAEKEQTLNIIAADGRMMTKNTITAGQRETKINTARWAAGTYLYQLQEDGKNIESGKFIVR